MKVALQPWPTLAGMKALIDFGVNHDLHETYFRADYFCKYNHDDVEYRQKTRKLAVDHAEDSGHATVPIVEMDEFFYEKKAPRTIADLNYGLVSGSSSSLSRSSSGGVVLRSRFSVMGSEAGYSETVDGDRSDFGMTFGVYRQ